MEYFPASQVIVFDGNCWSWMDRWIRMQRGRGVDIFLTSLDIPWILSLSRYSRVFPIPKLHNHDNMLQMQNLTLVAHAWPNGDRSSSRSNKWGRYNWKCQGNHHSLYRPWLGQWDHSGAGTCAGPLNPETTESCEVAKDDKTWLSTPQVCQTSKGNHHAKCWSGLVEGIHQNIPKPNGDPAN